MEHKKYIFSVLFIEIYKYIAINRNFTFPPIVPLIIQSISLVSFSRLIFMNLVLLICNYFTCSDLFNFFSCRASLVVRVKNMCIYFYDYILYNYNPVFVQKRCNSFNSFDNSNRIQLYPYCTSDCLL